MGGRRLYHPSVYDHSRPVSSYWEATAPAPSDDDHPLTTAESCDVAAINGFAPEGLHSAFDRRLLFGARGDSTGRPADGKKMKAWMQKRLGDVFPAWRKVPITHFWRGLVAVSRKLSPSVGCLEADPSVWYGYGYHANGVNTAPWVGRLLADIIAGKADHKNAVPAVMAGQPTPFARAIPRLWALRSAYLYYRFADRFLP